MKPILGILCIVFLFSLASCDMSKGDCLPTKVDSAKVAQAYYDKYPDEARIKIKLQEGDGPSKFYDRATVEKFQESWKKDAILQTQEGEPLEGFSFRGEAFRQLASDRRLDGIYLSFIKRDNGEFSLMVQGLDANFTLIDSLGFDANSMRDAVLAAYGADDLPKCPKHCPPPPPSN